MRAEQLVLGTAGPPVMPLTAVLSYGVLVLVQSWEVRTVQPRFVTLLLDLPDILWLENVLAEARERLESEADR